ncbi:MAG: ABC transporter permease [Acidimicrobiales bacterium]
MAVEASPHFPDPVPAAQRPSGFGGPGGRRGARRRSGVVPLRGLLPLAVLLGAWQLATGGHHSVFFPAPSTWIGQIRHLWVSDKLQPALVSTLETFVVSLVLATVIGTVVGVVVGRASQVARLLSPTLEYFRFLPGVALVPLAVLIVGYTQTMKIYVVVFGSVWPVLLQVRSNAQAVNPVLIDVARSMRLPRRSAFRKIVLPAVVPGVLLGVKLAAPLALVLVLVVEISTQVSGLGKLMETAQQNFQSSQVYGLIVIVGALAVAINLLVSLLESRLSRYLPASRRS